MILLLTTSLDPTANALVDRLEGRVFRLNFDLFADYSLALRPGCWTLSNPAGLALSSADMTAVFWWKAFNDHLPGIEPMVIEEVKYIFRELYHGGRAQGLDRGNPPDFHDRFGKMRILEMASRHFVVPQTLVTLGLAGVEVLKGPVVAKSLSSRLTQSGGAFYTTEVDPDQLHPAYPWYLQERIDSAADQTVFVCGQRLFGFERTRRYLTGLDWREPSAVPEQADWVSWAIPQSTEKAVRSLCHDLRVDWGRLDLMQHPGGHSVFLEFNANGQWAFLDPDHRLGLVDAVVEYLSAA